MRATLAPLLVIVACLLAGVFGIVHDQITYTLSPDYYHHFKFIQFGLQDSWMHPRFDAAVVGWRATWWMGLVVGLPLSLIGLTVPGIADYAWQVTRSFLIAIGTAAGAALIGLMIALPANVSGLYLRWFGVLRLPKGVTDSEAFMEVGLIHNASYLGGGLGLIVGIIYLLRTGKNMRKA